MVMAEKFSNCLQHDLGVRWKANAQFMTCFSPYYDNDTLSDFREVSNHGNFHNTGV